MAHPRGVFVAVELGLLGAAIFGAIWTRTTLETPILIGLCAVALIWKGLDKSILSSNRGRFWSELIEGLGWGAVAGVWLSSVVPAVGFRPRAAVEGVFLAGLAPVILRPILRRLVAHKKLVEDILIVGNGRLAEKLHQALVANRSAFGEKADSTIRRVHDNVAEVAGMSDFSGLPAILLEARISRVIVAEQDAQNRTKLAATLVGPRVCGLLVSDAMDFYEQVFGKVWIEGLSSEWLVYTGGFNQTRAAVFLKRCFDVVSALLMLVLGAPVLALTAIMIKLESTGPVLLRQERVGLNGKLFVLLKFRSMREDAEVQGGPTWAKECDKRVTRIGRLLRKFHIDEMPQAINVLRGEMSLVGPRPERPFFVQRLTEEIPFYNLRHCVKPGITGWAQVKYHYGASVEDACEKLQYDLYYIKHRSLAGDVAIVLNTVGLVLFGRGR
jgi:sugar transferase (PEP-CTERM system associated)